MLQSIPEEIWETIYSLLSTLRVLSENGCAETHAEIVPRAQQETKDRRLTSIMLHGPVWGCITSSHFGGSFSWQEQSRSLGQKDTSQLWRSPWVSQYFNDL